MSLSLSDYTTFSSKKPSERYLENNGQVLIELLEKKLNVKFTTTSNDTKTFKGNGLTVIETGPFQLSDLEVKVGFEGQNTFKTMTLNTEYSFLKYPDGTVRGFEVFKRETYPYIEMQTTYSHPLVPSDTGSILYQVKGTSGYNGIPEEVKNAFYGLLELLDRSYDNNKNSGGKGIVKSLSSNGKSISYDDGGLTNILSMTANVDPLQSNIIKDVIHKYGLSNQPVLI